MSSIYRKGEVLGWGTVAVVYRGWDELLDRSVAIKELKQPFAGNEPFSRAFRAQALKMLDISSRYVLATHSVDVDRSTQAVIRELAGETVGQRNFQGPMDPETVMRLLRQVLAGLDALHAREVVHCAVKPENIFVFGEDYKIGDFGLLPMEGTPTPPLSRYRYSSPEQIREPDEVGKSSDVYSLGVVAYELILGPLRLEQVVEEILRELGGEADRQPHFHASGLDLPPIHELEPAVPAALSLTLQKMVCKDLSSRFANCKKVLASLGMAAPAELPTGSQRLSISVNVPAPVAPPGSREGASGKWAWAGGGALAVAALVAGGGWWLGQGGQKPAVQNPAVQNPIAESGMPAVPKGLLQQEPEAEVGLADRLLRLRSTEGGLTVTLEPPLGGDRPLLALKTPLHFRVQSQGGGRLLLFALSPDGSITCLYPNAIRPMVLLDKGSSLVLPSDEDYRAGLDLTAQEPAGRQLVFALVSSKGMPPFPTGDDSGTLRQYPSGAPAQVFADWLEKLRKEDSRETRMAALDFEIGAAR
jgi:hypothetical protein